MLDESCTQVDIESNIERKGSFSVNILAGWGLSFQGCGAPLIMVKGNTGINYHYVATSFPNVNVYA